MLKTNMLNTKLILSAKIDSLKHIHGAVFLLKNVWYIFLVTKKEQLNKDSKFTQIIFCLYFSTCFLALYHVFRVSITYQIGQISFNLIFNPKQSRTSSCFDCKLFCSEDIFQVICLN